jgi:phosphoserine phosphatase RsbU/P
MCQKLYVTQHEDVEVRTGCVPKGTACQQPLQQHELEAARQVQQKLFPDQMPIARGWEFAGHCRPARILAGDYYDVFDLGSGRIVLAIGDVAGKGLGPSLVMAGLHAMIRSRISQYIDKLPECMHELNQYLLASTPDDMFVTLFLGVLDAGTGRLTFVNAGHPQPILLDLATRQSLHLSQGGALLGVLPDVVHEQGEIHMQPGTLLALFSDGVADARNENGERFEEQRLREALLGAHCSPATAALSGVLAAMDRFAVSSQLGDDIALVIIRRHSL